MDERVKSTLQLLEQQLDDEAMRRFRVLADDQLMFTVEVISAHVDHKINLPDDLLRKLVSTMNRSFVDD